MRKSWMTIGIIVFVISILIMLYLILGMRVYTKTDVTQIDSLSVRTTDVKMLKSQFPALFRSREAKRLALPDTGQVVALEVFHKHADTPLSDNEKLHSIDQFYYNTYDRLINTLAILLTTASIFIAFFGGVIPFVRSEKAEKLLEKVTLQIGEAQRSQQNLEELFNKSRELENRIRKLIDSLKLRADDIRGKIVAKSGNIDEILKFTPPTRQQLQTHYDDTETLLNLGEELETDNIMMRCIYFIANNMDDDYKREFEDWNRQDHSERPYIISGIAFGNVGAPGRSIECYDKALQLSPGNYLALYNKALALDGMKQYNEALKCYNQTLQLKPDFLEAWINKGIVYAKLNLYEDAISSYDQALAILPDDAEAWFDKGNAYAKLGKCPEALNCFEHALKTAPDHPEAWYNKGNAHCCLGHYEEAIACYDQALRIRPEYAQAFCNKGYMLYRLQNYPDALYNLDQALKIKPDFKDALVNKGHVYKDQARYTDAIRCYAQALDLAPDDHEALLGKGVAHREAGDLEAALLALDRASEIKPEDAPTWLELARVYMLKQDKEKTLAALQKAVELDPETKLTISGDKLFSGLQAAPEFAALLA